MPIWVASLLGGLLEVAGSLVGRVLLALGFGYAAYTGVVALMDGLQADVISKFSLFSPTIIGILAALKVDVSIRIIFAAIMARLVLAGLTSDTLKRMVVK